MNAHDDPVTGAADGFLLRQFRDEKAKKEELERQLREEKAKKQDLDNDNVWLAYENKDLREQKNALQTKVSELNYRLTQELQSRDQEVARLRQELQRLDQAVEVLKDELKEAISRKEAAIACLQGRR
jgi:predicted RNase H-like nuclease (RuvC/YqgF family)